MLNTCGHVIRTDLARISNRCLTSNQKRHRTSIAIVTMLLILVVGGQQAHAQLRDSEIPSATKLNQLLGELRLRPTSPNIAVPVTTAKDLRQLFETPFSRSGYQGNYYLQIEPNGRFSVWYEGGRGPGGGGARANTYRDGRWVNVRTRKTSSDAKFRIEQFVSKVFKLPDPETPIWGRMDSGRHPDTLFVNDQAMTIDQRDDNQSSRIRWIRLDSKPADVRTLSIVINESYKNLDRISRHVEGIENIELELYPSQESQRPRVFSWIQRFSPLKRLRLESSLKLSRAEFKSLLDALPPTESITVIDAIPPHEGSSPSEFSGFRSRPELKKLTIAGALKTSDMRAITAAAGLEHLAIRLDEGSRIGSFDWLKDLSSLKVFVLQHPQTFGSGGFEQLLMNLSGPLEKLAVLTDLKGFERVANKELISRMCEISTLRSIELQGQLPKRDLTTILQNRNFQHVTFTGTTVPPNLSEVTEVGPNQGTTVGTTSLAMKWQLKHGVHTVDSMRDPKQAREAKQILEDLLAAKRGTVVSQQDIQRVERNHREVSLAIVELQAELGVPRKSFRLPGSAINDIDFGISRSMRRGSDQMADAYYRIALESKVRDLIDYRESLAKEHEDLKRKSQAPQITLQDVLDLAPAVSTHHLPKQILTQEQLAYEIADLGVRLSAELGDNAAAFRELQKLVALDGRASIVGIRLNDQSEWQSEDVLDISSSVDLSESQPEEIRCIRKDHQFSIRKVKKQGSPPTQSKPPHTVVVSIRSK